MRRHHLPQSSSEYRDSDHYSASGERTDQSLTFPEYDFPARAEAIQMRLEGFNPRRYDQSRNHLNGHLSYLSPYISRGYLTLPYLKAYILQRYEKKECYRFIYELAWREYFQRVWAEKGDAIYDGIRQDQQQAVSDQMPAAVVNAETGIEAIDAAIRKLYETGYMHNHFRMYVAAIVCNIARTRWQTGAEWMYRHLLDADPASNYLSWQWVAGTFSSKKYYCNQENINRYSGSRQRGSFLDVPYEAFTEMPVPDVLSLRCKSPVDEPGACDPSPVQLQGTEKILLYTPFHLDPQWRSGESGARVLCLKLNGNTPALGNKTITFIRSLAEQLAGIQIINCSPDHLRKRFPDAQIITRAHPSIGNMKDIHVDPAPLLFPEVRHPLHSFSSYWKKAEKYFGSTESGKSDN